MLEGSLQRPNFDEKNVQRELEIIKQDLHCNAVRIQGLDLGRMKRASEFAGKLGLEVWFSPEMFEKSQGETFNYLVEASVVAESLRKDYPKIIFSLGSELTLFMQGLLEGNNLMERMGNPSFRENVTAGKHNEPLNEFLARANAAARREFGGPVTYFSLPFEKVDWSQLDYVGVDLYRNSGMKDMYDRMLNASFAYGKPVVIGEFGCCTYQGAEKVGGQGWAIAFKMMADFLGKDLEVPGGMSEIFKQATRVDGHFVRDEGLQARELVDQLGVLDAARVEGAFAFTFVSPLSYYNEDPWLDTDMPSYSLVKSYPEKDSFDEIYRHNAQLAKDFFKVDMSPQVRTRFSANLGRHGVRYPEMPWEPKESFRAVADYYSKN